MVENRLIYLVEQDATHAHIVPYTTKPQLQLNRILTAPPKVYNLTE